MLDFKVGSWQPIQNSLTIISEQVHHTTLGQERQVIPCSLEAYSFVYQQCTSKPSRCESMLLKFKELLSAHLKRNIQFSEDCHLIREFNTLWKSYHAYAILLSRRVFNYLDRYFLQGREQDSLMEVAIALFNDHILGTGEKKRMFIEFAVRCMGEMRTRLCITNNFLYAFTKNLLTINPSLFSQLYSIFFIETEAFYKQKFINCKYLTPTLYYARLSNLVLFEQAMIRQCFAAPPETAMKGQVILPLLFAKHLVFPYTDLFLEHPNGLEWGLKHNKTHLLNLVVEIYSKFEGFDKIKQRYYNYLLSEGAIMVKEMENLTEEAQIIKKVADFFDQHLKVLTEGFQKHQELYATETNAMEAILSKWDKANFYLLTYSKKAVWDGSFYAQQTAFKAVFERLSGKDEFLHSCEQWVEQAILNSPHELNKFDVFVEFLHELEGGESTMKLHKLLKDYHQHNQLVSVDSICCTVLGLHLWERTFKNQITIRPTLPAELLQMWQGYEQPFIAQNPKIKLVLLPLSTKLELRVRLNSKSTTLKCNILQACVLFALSKGGGKLILEQLVQQLTVQKQLILRVVDKSQLFGQDGVSIWLNWDYSMEDRIDWSAQVEQARTFSRAVEQDRSILMEAGVVRFVKRKKETTFEQVYDYLCERIRLFRPQPVAVKTTIGKLINREFIEVNQMGLYVYKQ